MSTSAHALVHSTFKRHQGACRSKSVDLALAVMCMLQRPNERFSCKTIAEVTGMSHNAPFLIQKRALKKLRIRLSAMKQAVAA